MILLYLLTNASKRHVHGKACCGNAAGLAVLPATPCRAPESLNARPAAETLQVWLRSLRSCIQESGTAKNYRPYLSTLLCATVMHITRLPDKR